VKDRALDNLYTHQAEFMKDLDSNLKKLDVYGLSSKHPDLMDLLKAMLATDPAERISPS
jgi:hypothetical protein